MAREVDARKTRKALRRLRKVAEAAAPPEAPKAAGGDGAGGPGAPSGPPLTPWEREFVEGVSQRLETYGSAFRDPVKGALDEPLSVRQAITLKALQNKTRPRAARASAPSAGPEGAAAEAPAPPVRKRAGLTRRKPMGAAPPPRAARSREPDPAPEIAPEPAPEPAPHPPRPRGRPRLTVIPGGREG